MSESLIEKIKQESATLSEINIRNCAKLFYTCSNCLAECEFKGEKSYAGRFVNVDDVLKILSGYEIKPLRDIRIRTVKVLQGRAKEEAEKNGLKPDDLVIVTNGVNIEKIHGDPVSYLLKRAKTSDKFVVVEKQKLQELADLLKNRPKRKPKGYTDIEKRRAELYTYIAMLDNWAEVLVKKFVEAFGESAKETTTK